MDANIVNKLDSGAMSVDTLVSKSNETTSTTTPVKPQGSDDVRLQANAEPEHAQESQQAESEPSESENQQESFQARNFKELRSFTEQLRKEREALAKENEQLRKYYQQNQNATPQTAQEQAAYQQAMDDLNIPDDEIVEGKHAKQIYKTAKQALEEQKRLQQQLEVMRIEREIEKEMPDYYSVVTPETVSAFRDLDPEMAQIIASYPNIKAQAKAVYKAIHGRNLHKMADYETPKKLVANNKQRPPSTPSVAQSGGESPLGRAMDYYSGDYTEQMKKMYYEQMKKAQMGR